MGYQHHHNTGSADQQQQAIPERSDAWQDRALSILVLGQMNMNPLTDILSDISSSSSSSSSNSNNKNNNNNNNNNFFDEHDDDVYGHLIRRCLLELESYDPALKEETPPFTYGVIGWTLSRHIHYLCGLPVSYLPPYSTLVNPPEPPFLANEGRAPLTAIPAKPMAVVPIRKPSKYLTRIITGILRLSRHPNFHVRLSMMRSLTSMEECASSTLAPYALAISRELVEHMKEREKLWSERSEFNIYLPWSALFSGVMEFSLKTEKQYREFGRRPQLTTATRQAILSSTPLPLLSQRYFELVQSMEPSNIDSLCCLLALCVDMTSANADSPIVLSVACATIANLRPIFLRLVAWDSSQEHFLILDEALRAIAQLVLAYNGSADFAAFLFDEKLDFMHIVCYYMRVDDSVIRSSALSLFGTIAEQHPDYVAGLMLRELNPAFKKDHPRTNLSIAQRLHNFNNHTVSDDANYYGDDDEGVDLWSADQPNMPLAQLIPEYGEMLNAEIVQEGLGRDICLVVLEALHLPEEATFYTSISTAAWVIGKLERSVGKILSGIIAKRNFASGPPVDPAARAALHLRNFPLIDCMSTVAYLMVHWDDIIAVSPELPETASYAPVNFACCLAYTSLAAPMSVCSALYAHHPMSAFEIILRNICHVDLDEVEGCIDGVCTLLITLLTGLQITPPKQLVSVALMALATYPPINNKLPFPSDTSPSPPLTSSSSSSSSSSDNTNNNNNNNNTNNNNNDQVDDSYDWEDCTFPTNSMLLAKIKVVLLALIKSKTSGPVLEEVINDPDYCRPEVKRRMGELLVYGGAEEIFSTVFN
eukprot:TRINITY_DN6810_c0_g1_i2.p1 TRINITY_DN6810_c0_g1~~TRINITY_DN6810_c0_g1_i2.p1  ORF type:complete len:905 (-),score=181.30 TRINITY_DN6810_c0_g1_i2:418-2874(-)